MHDLDHAGLVFLQRLVLKELSHGLGDGVDVCFAKFLRILLIGEESLGCADPHRHRFKWIRHFKRRR